MKNFWRFGKRERNMTSMEKEDFLLRQIDEFKEKAKQLQGMLATKESRVQELQNIVSEREEKADKLETILKNRQKEADGIMGSVREQIDDMIAGVDAEIEKLGIHLTASVNEGVQENSDKIDEMINALGAVNETLESVKRSITEKIHSENVKCYRNIQMLVIEMNKKTVQQEQYNKDMQSLHSMVKCITWVSIINFAVLAVSILFQLGVLR